MVGPRRPLIVLFGSSIVQYSFGHGGWGATLADFCARQADVVLRGYAGWNSRQALQVLPTIFPKDEPVQPSLVIVYFGGNDSCRPHPYGLSAHVPLLEYKENMRQIGLYIKSLSETTRIIFLSCPPVNEEMLFESLRTYEACREYSNACIQVCNELSRSDPSFKVIDLFNAIQTCQDWANTCFLDGIHFTAVASEIVVAELLKTIREAKWEPSLYLDDLPTEFADVILGLLLPVATASAERVFSAMNVVKKCFKNKIGDKWMTDCLITCIEKDLFEGVDNERIIQRFQNICEEFKEKLLF